MKEMVELNDDLTVEILQRMPLKSIFRCRCVSKNWQSLISHHPLLRCFGQGMGGKLYVVFVGRQPGIYTSWEECHIQDPLSLHQPVQWLLTLDGAFKLDVNPSRDFGGVHDEDNVLV
ncbi:hypothetical protein AAC387_Pa03g2423 [Persea americana]